MSLFPRNQRAIHHLKIEEIVALQPFEKSGASEGCGVCIWKSARLPSKNEGKGLGFCLLFQLFDMEMVEVTVRLILQALSLALDKP